MADNKKDQKAANEHFLGRDIDPELVKKVDEYMEPNSVEPESVPTAPKEFAEKEPEAEAASAPLLPSDKLPDLEKDTKTTKPESKQAPKEQIREEETESLAESEAIEPVLAEADDLDLEDPKTDKAVDDIVASEADALLEAEDNAKKPREQETPHKRGVLGRLKAGLAAWWGNKLARNSTIALVVITLIVLAIVPTTRYGALNAVGVRASLNMKVLDEKTSLPLKNATLTVDGVSAKSDSEGNVKVEKIELGSRQMTLKKAGFADIDRKVVIGWGSNPQGDTKLTPTGTQYSFKVADFLSNKPIKKAEAVSGEASALSSESGEIILTVPQSDANDIDVSITATDYRNETLKLKVESKDVQNIAMAPAKKHAFISKRTGTFDLYKIDVDGKNEEKLLSGTGRERADSIALAVHPKKNLAALVSTRDNLKNSQGFLLSTLLIVDLDTGETKRAADSERIQLVEWLGDRLVFVKITQGASEANLDRHKLISYDAASGTEKELASTNYFNDVLAANGAVYYSPAQYKVNGSVGLYKIQADGTGKKTIFDKEVWNLLRTDYDKISASVGQEWYELTLSNGGWTKAANAPSVLKSRLYSDNPTEKNSLWVDERDGKGVLVLYGIESHDEKVLTSQSGLKNPVIWASTRHAVYRVNNGQETADYVLSTDGGVPKKIRDVTNAAGIDRWYYY